MQNAVTWAGTASFTGEVGAGIYKVIVPILVYPSCAGVLFASFQVNKVQGKKKKETDPHPHLVFG